MVIVAASPAREDLLGQKALPPEGDQALEVQVLGMNCPESHDRRNSEASATPTGECSRWFAALQASAACA